MTIFINPGSGPVPDATEENAAINITVFADDLRRAGLGVTNATRHPEADYGEGRYAFALAMADGRTIEIQMPGLPVDRVRYLGEDGQNIWDFPRLYVDGSSYRARGWTQAEAAQRVGEIAGAPPQSKAAWSAAERAPETGRPKSWTANEIAALAELFGVPVGDLFEAQPPCRACNGQPPAGFTCNTCGAAGEGGEPR